jgi:hypothetical protein
MRRSGPRVDYRHYMSVAAAPDGPAPSAPQPEAVTAPEKAPAKPERDYAPLAAVGGIAVLGLMLLVGVLIGKGNSSTSSAPAPVVRVGGGGSNSSTAAESGSGGPSKAASASKPAGTGAKKVKGGLTGEAASKSQGTVQASTKELEELNSETGASAEEQIKKLPDKIATPGKPPPIDKSKPPGGGSGGGEVIK